MKKFAFFIAYLVFAPFFNTLCTAAGFKPYVVILLIIISLKLISYLYNLRQGKKLKSIISLVWALVLIAVLAATHIFSVANSDVLVYGILQTKY
jgi:hypothetical protein